RGQNDRNFSRAPQLTRFRTRMGFRVVAQMPGESEDFAERYAGKLRIVPEEEPRRAKVVSMRHPPRGIGAFEGTIDAYAPLLRSEASRAAQKTENDIGKSFGIIRWQLNTVGHIHFRQSAASADTPRRFKHDR